MSSNAPETTAGSAPALISTAPVPVLMLRGSAALSPFRLDRLMNRLRVVLPAIETLYAEYRHFAALDQALGPQELDVLERLLTYGPKLASHAPQGELLLTVPRLGTISDRNSQATRRRASCC